LKAQSSYSQSVDSLPLKELNKEFFKGIKARERAAYLQKVHALDSAELSLYKDSILPACEQQLVQATEDVNFLNNLLIVEEQEKKFYQYSALGLAIVVFLQIIF
jgi:hypothetical protein